MFCIGLDLGFDMRLVGHVVQSLYIDRLVDVWVWMTGDIHLIGFNP